MKNKIISKLVLYALILALPRPAEAFSFRFIGDAVISLGKMGGTAVSSFWKKIQNNPLATVGIVGTGALLVAAVIAAKKYQVYLNVKKGEQDAWNIDFNGQNFPYINWVYQRISSRPETPSSNTSKNPILFNDTITSNDKNQMASCSAAKTPLPKYTKDSNEENNSLDTQLLTSLVGSQEEVLAVGSCLPRSQSYESLSLLESVPLLGSLRSQLSGVSQVSSRVSTLSKNSQVELIDHTNKNLSMRRNLSSNSRRASIDTLSSLRVKIIDTPEDLRTIVSMVTNGNWENIEEVTASPSLAQKPGMKIRIAQINACITEITELDTTIRQYLKPTSNISEFKRKLPVLARLVHLIQQPNDIQQSSVDLTSVNQNKMLYNQLTNYTDMPFTLFKELISLHKKQVLLLNRCGKLGEEITRSTKNNRIPLSLYFNESETDEK